MIKVGIKLEDEDFAKAFVRGLMSQGRNFYFVLQKECCEDETIDFLLSEEASADGSVIELVKNPDEQRIFEGPPYRLFRYDQAGRLLHNLLFIFYQKTGRNMEFSGETRCKTLLFSSISCGIGSTALALATSENLYKYYGCKCLYLNLCPIDGSKRFLSQGNGKGLLNLLYHLDQERDFPLEAFLMSTPYFDYIDTRISNPFFDEMSALQAQRLKEKIDTLGKYDFLILDMGNHLSRNNKQLLNHTEHVVLLDCNQDRLSESFFSEVKSLYQSLAEEADFHSVTLESTNFFGEQEKKAVLDNGFLDISALKEVQREAGKLGKHIMERTIYDRGNTQETDGL